MADCKGLSTDLKYWLSSYLPNTRIMTDVHSMTDTIENKIYTIKYNTKETNI